MLELPGAQVAKRYSAWINNHEVVGSNVMQKKKKNSRVTPGSIRAKALIIKGISSLKTR